MATNLLSDSVAIELHPELNRTALIRPGRVVGSAINVSFEVCRAKLLGKRNYGITSGLYKLSLI